ncbi:MAG: glyoxylate/hydroxypyruvate reductase A [Rhizobiaceae bacterium]|nr:glyoxylate/hydroxypyruvate reductase A [Rhizobiaceae bacterium]
MTKPAILLDLKWENLTLDQPFREAFPNLEVLNWAKEEDRSAELSTVKYAIVWAPETGLLARFPNLEVIFSVGAGVDHIFKDTQLPDVEIVRFVDPMLTGPMVEWVVLQVLMQMRQQRLYDEQQRRHKWQELPQPSAPKFRIGIMGFGELGQACAAQLKGFGFTLNGWSQSPKNVDGVTSYCGLQELPDFLNNTDILVSLLPLTQETRGLINKQLIDGLSREGPFGAPIVINAGRGGSQVEADILSALRDGRLHGASLDVFETEPLPSDNQLWDQDNLIITPHAAAMSDPLALAAHVAQQIERHETGQGLQYLVDRKRGY